MYPSYTHYGLFYKYDIYVQNTTDPCLRIFFKYS